MKVTVLIAVLALWQFPGVAAYSQDGPVSENKFVQVPSRVRDYEYTVRGVIMSKIVLGGVFDLQIAKPTISTSPAGIKVEDSLARLTGLPDGTRPYFIHLEPGVKIEKLVNGKRLAAGADDLNQGVEVAINWIGRKYAPYYLDSGTLMLDSVLMLDKRQAAPNHKIILLDNSCDDSP